MVFLQYKNPGQANLTNLFDSGEPLRIQGVSKLMAESVAFIRIRYKEINTLLRHELLTLSYPPLTFEAAIQTLIKIMLLLL